MERKKGKVMGKWGDGSLHERKKGKVMGEGANCRRYGGCRKRLIAWEKKGGSDGQVGERKEKKRKGKERKMGCCIGLRFGPKNGGVKWAMMGWNCDMYEK